MHEKPLEAVYPLIIPGVQIFISASVALCCGNLSSAVEMLDYTEL